MHIGFVAKRCLNLAIGKPVYSSSRVIGDRQESAVDGLKDWRTAPVFAVDTHLHITWVAIDMGMDEVVGSVHIYNYPYGESGCFFSIESSLSNLHRTTSRVHVTIQDICIFCQGKQMLK